MLRSIASVWRRRTSIIAVLSTAGILAHLVLRFAIHTAPATARLPLMLTLAVGGVPLVVELLTKLLRREFGSDLLAGMSIVTSVLLGEYLAGSIVVLMLAGGEALESYALRSAGRMRSIALHSAVGGTLLSIAGMLVAASGHLSPVEGAISQEVIDVACGGEGSASF